MGMDDPEAGKKVYQLAAELLDDLSIDELQERIEHLRLEIGRCEGEIASKNSTKETAESVFRK